MLPSFFDDTPFNLFFLLMVYVDGLLLWQFKIECGHGLFEIQLKVKTKSSYGCSMKKIDFEFCF